MSLSPTMKVSLLAAAAAAFFAGAAVVAVQPAKAADYYGNDRNGYGRHADRYDFGNDADDDVRGSYQRRHGGWNRPVIRTVTAQGSYASDYLPFHVKQWRARQTAIGAWKNKVANIYGVRFSNFRVAQNKRVNCDAGAGSVYCTVSARPARGFGYGWGGGWGGGWRGAGRND